MDTITPQLYSGALRPYPGVLAEWSTAKQARARSILADVDAAFPGMVGKVDPSADVEDFWEDAARISAAWRATGGRLVLKEAGTSRCAWSNDKMLRRIGPVARSEEGGDHGTDDLAGHALVAHHGGRGMFVGGVATDDPARDVAIWLAARHRDHGIRRGVVKTVARKNGIWSIELDRDPEVITRRLAEVMDWTFVRLEGLPGALLAQDELELTWELRLFVVDGRVVSAAGCIEEFTPLDHDRATGLIDTRVRRIRGHLEQGLPSPVEDRPDIVHRLVSFGRRVALEHGGTVCIDVAIDAATDTPVVIELNHLPNSGLYASDPWAVTAAIVRARDRGYAPIRRLEDVLRAAPTTEGIPA